MSMTKENLVVLKGQSNFVIRETQTTFEANKHYRCIEFEGEFLVYGVKMNRALLNEMFEPLHDRIMNDMSEEGVGLLPMMKPLSKKAFIETMDLHQYGKGKNKLFIGFFGNKMDGIIAFYPSFKGDTKAQFLKGAYENYCNTLNGEMDAVDSDLVQRGNSGIPLCYGDIYFRKPYNPDNKDLAIYY